MDRDCIISPAINKTPKPITYKGIQYNPSIAYFGPEDHWLSSIIPKAPIGLEDLFKSSWNLAAFKHDVDYSLSSGEPETGFIGYIKNAINRRKADKDFYNELVNSAYNLVKKTNMTVQEYEDTLEYAHLAFLAVRSGGALFYKKSYMPNDPKGHKHE